MVVAHAREVNLNGTDLEVLYGTLVPYSSEVRYDGKSESLLSKLAV